MAAEQRDSFAILELCNLLADHRFEERLEWLKKGKDSVMTNGRISQLLGEAYLNGLGCEVQIWTALKYFKIAAEYPNPEALCQIVLRKDRKQTQDSAKCPCLNGCPWHTDHLWMYTFRFPDHRRDRYLG